MDADRAPERADDLLRTTLDRRALIGGGLSALAGSLAMGEPVASTAAVASGADQAWRDYLQVIDKARSRALASRWAQTPINRAQAMYYISMLQAFGFNLYMAPRQAYPTFFSHLIFTPVEYNWGAPSPDFRYHWTAIDGARTYRIWGQRGHSSWLDIQAQRGWWGDADQSHLGNWDVDKFALGQDGSFEIIASATMQQGNWMKLDPTAHNTCVLVRDIWDDWECEGASIHIELLDRKPTDTVFLHQEEIGHRLGQIAFQTRFSVDWYLASMDRIFANAGGYNRFWLPGPSPTNLGGNPRASYVHMIYDLKPDQALIIETEIPNARYWSLQLADNFYQTVDYRFHQASLNNKQARLDADGKVRVVLSAVDPGVPNWVDPAGLMQGLAMWRWYLSDRFLVPTVTKVSISEVRRNLPADTPRVSAEQRAQQLAWRRREVGRRFGV
jgi:hypothetical protein